MRDAPLSDPLSDPLPASEAPAPGVRRGAAPATTPVAWTLAAFAGRFAELSAGLGGAPLALVFRLVLEAQRTGEPVAWIARPDSAFFPPDVADAGVDLAALPVVRAGDALAAARVADLLVRSGAFGLVVLDLGPRAELPLHAQTRLVGLSQQHGTAVVCLTEKGSDRPSIGSLVSLRAHAARSERRDERYRCRALVLKDKRRGPGWEHTEICRAPDGLR